jgi:hypothetical protein
MVEKPTPIISITEAEDVAAPATWDRFAPTFEKKKELWIIAMRLDLLTPYQGAARDELVLRRERLESGSAGKTEPQEDVTIRNLGKEGKVIHR